MFHVWISGFCFCQDPVTSVLGEFFPTTWNHKKKSLGIINGAHKSPGRADIFPQRKHWNWTLNSSIPSDPDCRNPIFAIYTLNLGLLNLKTNNKYSKEPQNKMHELHAWEKKSSHFLSQILSNFSQVSWFCRKFLNQTFKTWTSGGCLARKWDLLHNFRSTNKQINSRFATI